MPIMVDMIAPVTPVRPGVGALAIEPVPVPAEPAPEEPVEEPPTPDEPAAEVEPLNGV